MEQEELAVPVTRRALVIGGGVAGIEAALTAAEAGRKVTLVEREISLGGAVIRTEDLAPNMECSPCLLAPRLDEVRDHDRIEVLTGADLRESDLALAKLQGATFDGADSLPAPSSAVTV